MIELALAGLLLCIAAGTGMAILRVFKFNCRWWENIGIGIALGLGLLAHILLALGLFGWLYSKAVWAVIGILIPPAIWGFSSSIKLKGIRLPTVGKWERLGIGILAWCAFFNIFVVLAPPFLADTLKYHLAAPKWYISLHQIQFAPSFSFNLPQSVEMLYTAGMLLHNHTVGLLLHYAMGPLIALGIWALAREFLPSRIAIWSAVFFYAGIPFIPHAGQGNDLGPIFYTVWAFYAFVKWRNTTKLAWLSLAGVLVGLCIGTKYTGAYSLFGLLFMVVVAVLEDRESLRPLFLFCFFFILFGCPWYLKNWIMSGNPIYPIFYPILGGKGWNLASYQEGIRLMNEDLGVLGRSFFDYLISPLKFLLIQNKVFVRGGMGLLLSSFVPAFLLVGKRYAQRYIWWIYFSLPFYLAWVVFAQHGRFLLPLLALWCIPCAGVAFKLMQEGGYLRTLSIFTLLLGIGMGAALAPVYATKFIPVVIGLESRDSFLTKTTLFYQDIQWMNENLPADAIVMSNFANLYYLDRQNIWMMLRKAGWIDYGRVKSMEDVLKQGRKFGATHIFVFGGPNIRNWDYLVTEGLIEQIYYNPQGRLVTSISMGVSHYNPVAVYRIKSTSSGKF